MASILVLSAISMLFGSFLRKAYDNHMLLRQQDVHTSTRTFEFGTYSAVFLNSAKEWFELHPEFKLLKAKAKYIIFGDQYKTTVVYKAPPGKQLAFSSSGSRIEIVKVAPNAAS